ncbi:MAG: hypothetical protein HYZ14_10180 [Bacteroidetes bacterium]|nr:hypothetical protein [Bacteroidota bacterium]
MAIWYNFRNFDCDIFNNLRYLTMKVTGIIVFFFPLLAFGKGVENDTFLIRKEAEINVILTDLRKAETDMEREMINMDLQEELKNLLVYPGVMNYPFAAWTTMSTISAPDGAFRLFNWNVEDEFGMHSHFCFLVKPDNANENTIIQLAEDRLTITPRPEQTLTADHWYGALYYNIVPVKKGNKTLYTIFGYNGNDNATNRKLLDVFYFKGKSLRMGYPLFQEGPGSAHLLRRVFFEYSEKAIISLRVNDNLGAIVFDHLVPETPQLEGIYDYYIPDMTYDGYKWENGIWVYVEDIIAYNDPNETVRQYIPTDDGDVAYREVDDTWTNPVDPDAPAGSGTNAVAPIENVNDKDKNRKAGQSGKQHQFKFVHRLKGPRSAVTGERVKKTKKRRN